jgi:hypothetical protein
MRRTFWILITALFVAIGAPCAHADGVVNGASHRHAGDVVYNFIATDSSFPGGELAFQLTLPDFVDTPVGTESLFFTCAQLDSSTNCGSAISLWISTGPSADQVDFGATNSINYAFIRIQSGIVQYPGNLHLLRQRGVLNGHHHPRAEFDRSHAGRDRVSVCDAETLGLGPQQAS